LFINFIIRSVDFETENAFARIKLEAVYADTSKSYMQNSSFIPGKAIISVGQTKCVFYHQSSSEH